MPFEPVANPTPNTDDALADLGAHLIEAGVIDQRSLDRARRVAAEAGSRLDRILTQLGLVSERSLAEVLARMLAAPLLRSTDYPASPLFAERLKAKFLRKARAMPVSADDSSVTLA